MAATRRSLLALCVALGLGLATAAKLPSAPWAARSRKGADDTVASDLGSSSSGVSVEQRRQQRRKRPRRAFQVTEPIYELSPSEYSGGKPYLLQFKGKGDDYCAQMEPLKEQLKEELGVEIRDFEVWYDSSNLELLQRLDKGRCGGVPFFYNKRSRRYICGATTYDNLRRWALCEPCEPILPPPNLNEDREMPKNKVQQFMADVKAKAAAKMRGGAEDDDDDDEYEDDEDE